MKAAKLKVNYSFFDCKILNQKFSNSSYVRVLIITNQDGVIALSIAQQDVYLQNQINILESYQIQFQCEEKKDDKIKKAIQDYFLGKNKSLNTLKVNWNLIRGTAFQKKVWLKIAEVSYGTSISYKQIAMNLKTRGYRAVGAACGANPVMILIPCHRIISSSSMLGGFSSGLALKKNLLKLEGIEYKD